MLIYEQLESLNDNELALYHYVLENKEKVASMSIRELASNAHVSTTVIYNFCDKAGCAGYSEFKYKLKAHMNPANHQAQSTASRDSVLDSLVNIAYNQAKQDKLHQAAALMATAGNITFVGVGQSGVMAKYGSIYFSNYGIPSRYIGDSYFRIPVNNDKDLVVAISGSGQNQEMISRVEKFREHKVPIVSITNTDANIIAKLANVSLTYNVPSAGFLAVKHIETYEVSVTSQVPVIYLIENLARLTQQKMDHH